MGRIFRREEGDGSYLQFGSATPIIPQTNYTANNNVTNSYWVRKTEGEADGISEEENSYEANVKEEEISQ